MSARLVLLLGVRCRRFAESKGVKTFDYAGSRRLTKDQALCFFELGHKAFLSYVSEVSNNRASI